jgi:hypothetical protein
MTDLVIKVDGKEYGFRFTNLTLRLMTDRAGLALSDLLDMATSKPIHFVMDMVWASNKVYSRLEKELSDVEVDNLIEEMSQDQMNEFYSSFLASIEKVGKKLSPKNEEEVKKN